MSTLPLWRGNIKTKKRLQIL